MKTRSGILTMDDLAEMEAFVNGWLMKIRQARVNMETFEHNAIRPENYKSGLLGFDQFNRFMQKLEAASIQG